MKPKAIFVTNQIYIDSSLNEGGVNFCTKEYIRLISEKFDLILFPVNTKKSIWYRLLVRLGFNNYQDFHYSTYHQRLLVLIEQNDIKHLFLNQCNTAIIGKEIKLKIRKNLSVIICSHGNESGDLLHDVTRFNNNQPLYKKIFSNWILGRTIRTEVFQRLNFIDGILTVSEVETQIENWLGAKKVMFVPRTINYKPIVYNNTIGIVGFIGDLSHPPNFFGLKKVLEALEENGIKKNFQLRIVGSSTKWGEKLEMEFPFVKYIGYLTNEELTQECESWSFFLNPVFYYSRGVSTKLAKALGMGLPVITTSIGKRGYQWTEGKLPEVKNPIDMAKTISNLAFDSDLIKFYRNEVKLIANSAPTFDLLGRHLNDFLES
jgi:glycosyltransferase involved in cell wall biosynthesis